MDERLENKRRVAYCPVTDRLVNLELSSIKKEEKKDIITSCTGIEDICHTCFIKNTGYVPKT
jgi:hypothetical protein